VIERKMRVPQGNEAAIRLLFVGGDVLLKLRPRSGFVRHPNVGRRVLFAGAELSATEKLANR
jgi:hypothetical protein